MLDYMYSIHRVTAGPHLYCRHGTPPFVSARSVLEPLLGDEVKVSEEVKINVQEVKIKSENHDILQLCNIVAMEVVNLGMVVELFNWSYGIVKAFQKLVLRPTLNII